MRMDPHAQHDSIAVRMYVVPWQTRRLGEPWPALRVWPLHGRQVGGHYGMVHVSVRSEARAGATP